MADYFDSLRMLLDFPVGFMFPAHGPPIAAAREKIQFYIDHRLQREESIFQAIGGPSSPNQIVPRVYTDIHPMVYPLAELNVRAHLEKLVADGRVVEKNDIFEKSGLAQ